MTLLCAALILTPTTAQAGSDSPTPYTVTAEGITLPAGVTFPAHGHVNWRTSWAQHGIHFDPNNGQPGGKYIGESFIPFNLEPGECVTWIQVSLFDEHFGEGGQDPICRELEPTPEPSSTPTPTLPPKPSPTEDPTWEPSEQPTDTPSPGPVAPAPKPSGSTTSAPSPDAPPSAPPVTQPSTPVALSASPALPDPATSSTPSPVTVTAPRPELPVTGGSLRYLIIAAILTTVGAGAAIYSRKKA